MTRTVLTATFVVLGYAAAATAGQAQGANDQAPAAAQQTTSAPSDRAVDPSEPDFTLIGLPTTLRISRLLSVAA